METIFSGELVDNEYILKQVKHMETQSVLKKTQIEALIQYLEKIEGIDGQFITINDQLPIKLSSEEVERLKAELSQIAMALH